MNKILLFRLSWGLKHKENMKLKEKCVGRVSFFKDIPEALGMLKSKENMKLKNKFFWGGGGGQGHIPHPSLT